MGGCIFAGAPIDTGGNVLSAGAYYVVQASGSLLANHHPVEVGQWWRVAGACRERTGEVNNYKLTELQIEASELELLLPSGEHVITLMAEGDEFRGIGYGKARRLWETFGSRIYDVLDQGDVATLAAVLTEESAQTAVAAWARLGDSRTLQWLQSKGFDVRVGRKLLRFYSAEARAKIEEDPYRLISFCGTWKATDSLARSVFKLAIDDHRRLRGAVEEALYRIFNAGHTCASWQMLVDQLSAILGPQTPQFPWLSLIDASLDQGLWNGSYVVGADDTIHPTGPLVMEAAVTRAIAIRMLATDTPPLADAAELDSLISRHEFAEDISLNAEQRDAVRIAATQPFAVITGGAGVGKTTVLKGVYAMFDRAGIRVFQMALAGRAAKRMKEATNRDASTIAAFLKNTKPEDLTGPTAVVVDEASMVDIITMYRLCGLLPDHVRLLLIGDPSQLMPVGPGLVLHALAGLPQVAFTELKIVKRHAGEIAHAALAVRQGIWPALGSDPMSSIAMLETANLGYQGDDSLSSTVLNLYQLDPPSTQILCSRRNGPDGTRWLNALCQQSHGNPAAPLLSWSNEHDSFIRTGLLLGDVVLCTKNLWAYGLQNGSLGRLVEVQDQRELAAREDAEERLALGQILWDDGERRPVYEDMLDDLELGYAITVHKGQGSQWPRVIVPITGNRLMDRTLLYTAITRAQRQVLMVGDAEAAKGAVMALPRAHHRRVGLTGLLVSHLRAGSTPAQTCKLAR